MKRTLFLLVACMLILFSTNAQNAQTDVWDRTHTTWTKGTGTQDDPYLIENAEQLAYLAYIVNNGIGAGAGRTVGANTYWKLTTNIDLNGSDTFQWTPIGYYISDANYYNFGGHFDGNGHTISNLYINSTTLQRIGLFGYTDGGSIKNTGIIGNSSITRGSNSIPAYAGGFVAFADNTSIDNCYNIGSISSSSYYYYSYYSYSGGIAGNSSSSITNCYNTGSISSSSYYSYSGGIAGNSFSNITNCYNTGSISSSSSYYYSYSGGIAGNSSSNITNCYNTGSISSSSSYSSYYSGGIAGYSTSNITNCYNTGSISSSYYSYLGGIAGYGNNVNNSYYLVTCGGNNTYGGNSRTATFMKTQEFVDLLNDTAAIYCMDNIPYKNNGYPLLVYFVDNPVKTLLATSVTADSATLNGYVSDSLIIVVKGFDYKMAQSQNFTRVTVNNNDTLFSYTLNGLNSSTEYYYRTFAITANDTLYGAIQKFNTGRIGDGTSGIIWDGTCSPWTKGSGTAEEPYLIEKPEHLCYLAYIVNNGIGSGDSGHTIGKDTYWKLMINIDLNGLPWSPIGNWVSGADYYNFGGHFDGNGHIIANLVINSTELERIGLFGSTVGGSIKDLGITGNSSITRSPPVSPTHSDPYAGGIVGYADGTPVTNCYSSCNISSDRSNPSYLGGIAGRTTSTISFCYNTGNISASNVAITYCGGIAGESTAAISNCFNTGNINDNGTRTNSHCSGGIAGTSSAAITDCYNTGNISSHYYCGGISGVYNVQANLSIKNCYNIGSISSSTNANFQGAIIGYLLKGESAVNCYYLNTCGGNNNAGGVSKTSEFMKTDEMVELLDSAFMRDVEPYQNQGYPILSGKTTPIPESTSVKNIVVEKHLNIYPNPATDYINIHLPENVQQAVFTVYDMQGKILIRQEISGQEVVPVSNLAAGIYIYNIITDKQNYTGKLRIKD